MSPRSVGRLLLAATVAGCTGGAGPPPPAPGSSSAPVVAILGTWHYPSPRCRRDDTLAPAVLAALTGILGALGRAHDTVVLEGGGAVPFRRVVVNDAGVESDVLHVELVSDAAAGAVDAEGCPRREGSSTGASDRDERSVDALCQALPVKDVGIIRCSADGLAALTAEDRRRQRPSPALTYVLAHELSHLLHGDGRNFLPAAQVVDLALPPEPKWKIVSQGCTQRSGSTVAVLDYERRADRDAMKVLQDVVRADAGKDPTQDPAVSVALASMAVWISTESIKHWSRRWEHGARLPSALVDAPLAPDDAYVRWSVDRVLCDVLTKTEGHVLVPTFNGTHPSEPERLALISVELARLAPRFHAVPGPLPEEIQELTARIGGANAISDVQQRAYFEAFGADLCQRARRGERPACDQVSPVGPLPRPSCPQLTASLVEHDLTLEPMSLSVRTSRDGSVEIGGSVRTALAMRDGRIFVGTVSPNGAAIVGAGGTRAWKLPCVPASAFEGATGVSVLCQEPFGILVLNDAGRAQFRAAEDIEYDGGSVSAGQIQGGWLGSVDGVLHATMHLPAAGKSTTIRFDDDGARSAKPWRSDGCDRLFTAMSVFRFDASGPVFGTSWSSRATSVVASFDPSFQRLSSYAHPTAEPHVMACGAANLFKSVVCVDTGGTAFDPLAPGDRKALLRFAASPELAKAQRVGGRVCSTTDGLYVQTIGAGGSVGVNEVFVARGAKPVFQRVFSDPSPEPELRCGESRATIVTAAGGSARIVRL